MASPEAAAAAMQSAARAMRELARVPSRASGPASKEIARLIQREFDTGTDPYGKPWRPLQASTIKRKGSTQINVDTRDLRRSIDVRPMRGAGIQVTIGVDYAAYVQLVRPILPVRALPQAWAAAIADSLTTQKRALAAGAGAGAPIVDTADAMLELAQLLGCIATGP